MIKNIIFDVGGVLLEWNPKKFLEKLGLPSRFVEVYDSLLWAMHDGGLLTRKELIEKLPEHVDRVVFSHGVSKIAAELNPISEMIDLFHALRRQGYKVYILSNMPEELHRELKELHPFFAHPAGQVYSYEVKALKPQPQIYIALLNTYKLVAAESVFIDDRMENVAAADKLKIKGIHCRSAPQVKRDLENLGVLFK